MDNFLVSLGFFRWKYDTNVYLQNICDVLNLIVLFASVSSSFFTSNRLFILSDWWPCWRCKWPCFLASQQAIVYYYLWWWQNYKGLTYETLYCDRVAELKNFRLIKLIGATGMGCCYWCKAVYFWRSRSTCVLCMPPL